MHRHFLALIALGASFALISCNKQDTQTPTAPLVSVRFAVGGYDSGLFPTKGMADAIAATLPATLDLTLTNTATGVEYQTMTGQEVTIPVGIYAVSGGYTPEATKLIYGTAVFLSHAPKVAVATEVAVTQGVTTYTLTAQYESVALAVLASETAQWIGATSDRAGFYIDALEDGDYRWTFLSGDLGDSRRFVTNLTPTDGGPGRSFTIVANPDLQINYDDALVVAPGRWYVLHPADVVTQSGTFAIEWPAWTAAE